MSVILKKNEKIGAIVEKLPDNYSFEDFLAMFKSTYPQDWLKINRSYEEHESKTKPNKSHPMPEPTQYLRNALNVYKNSLSKEIKK